MLGFTTLTTSGNHHHEPQHRQRGGLTHGERLLPAGSHYGGSDDADVELVLLLLHHELGQGFGVGVRVGPVADEPRRDVAHDTVVHPPEDRNEKGSGRRTQHAVVER